MAQLLVVHVSAEGMWSQGMKVAILVNWSSTVKIIVWPSESGSSTRKSRVIEAHGLGGMSGGIRVPRGLAWSVLVQAHKSQEST